MQGCALGVLVVHEQDEICWLHEMDNEIYMPMIGIVDDSVHWPSFGNANDSL